MIAHASTASHLGAVAVAVALTGGYGWCWLRTAARTRVRLLSWAAGLAMAVAVTTPTVERWAGRSFSAHMVQHLVLLIAVAPLLAMARPLATALTALPRAAIHRRRRRPAACRSRPADWAPLAAAGATVATFAAVHFSAWYDLALRSQLVHDAEHLAFVASTASLWAALRAPVQRRGPVRVVAAFIAIAGLALTAMVLLASRRPISTEHAARLGTDAAVADQRSGATLMWAAGMLITTPMLLLGVWRWASAEQRIAVAAERALDGRATIDGRRTEDRRTGPVQPRSPLGTSSPCSLGTSPPAHNRSRPLPPTAAPPGPDPPPGPCSRVISSG